MEPDGQDEAARAIRNPWLRGAPPAPAQALPRGASAVPRVAPPPWSLELRFPYTAEDEMAANRLWIDHQVRPGGLGGALLAGLIALGAMTWLRATGPWKQTMPIGTGLWLGLGLVLLFMAAGWLLSAHLLPRLHRWLLWRQIRRTYRAPGPGSGDTGAVTLRLDDQGLTWQAGPTQRWVGVVLLRGMEEDARVVLLSYGLFSYVALPQKALTEAQLAEIRLWMERHARPGP
jgi:hypothetical protein